MRVVIAFCVLICYVVGETTPKWYTSADGRKFYIEPEKKFNWFDAWNECTRKNMSLIAIDTLEKHMQIDAVIRKYFATTPQFWISGHDMSIDLRYEWITTGEIFTFTNWGPGQPGRTNNNEHCVLIWHDFNWHDLPCSGKNLGFICEENRYVKELEDFKKERDLKFDERSKFKNIFMYINSLN